MTTLRFCFEARSEAVTCLGVIFAAGIATAEGALPDGCTADADVDPFENHLSKVDARRAAIRMDGSVQEKEDQYNRRLCSVEGSTQDQFRRSS